MLRTDNGVRLERLESVRQQIVGIGQAVPLLDGSLKPYIFLDNAASTPTFRGVQEKLNEFLLWYSSVHRGTGFKSLISTEAYDQSREIVTRFLGGDPDNHTAIFGKNSSEAINKLARRIPFEPGDVVLTTVMEHHSNDLPWRPVAQVAYVDILPDGSLDMADLERKLEQHRGRVKLVATTGASNVTGYMPPIYDIAELAHQHGAMIFADCAQLAPHRPVNMGPVGAPRSLDFAAISAHKMYAPFGTGALVGPKSVFAQGDPDYRGGGTIELVSLDEVFWAAPPDRDEAGSPNVVGAVALAASIMILTDIGMDLLAQHEKIMTRYLLQKLNKLDGLTIYGSSDPERLDDRLGVVSFELEGIHHAKTAAVLGFEGGIGVRNGCFCAHPYILELMGIQPAAFQQLKAQVLQHDRTQVPGLVRASMGCFNTFDELDQLVEMLDRIIRGDYRGDYVVDKSTGFFWPRQFDRDSIHNFFSLGQGAGRSA